MTAGGENKHASSLSVALFFTDGLSLRIWDECGLFDRELALYRRLVDAGVEVTLVTYGGPEELAYSERLPGIRILCNNLALPRKVYAALLPRLHRKALSACDLFKTNQTDGALVALRAARYLEKPLLARCGYMWSKNVRIEYGADSKEGQRCLRIEGEVFGAADQVVVTTEEMRSELCSRLPGTAVKTRVVPNYVDTQLFQPAEEPYLSSPPKLLFVGRLAQEKNLENLLLAINGLDVELDIIGDGPLRSVLESSAARQTGVSFLGRVPNRQLPDLMHKATVFVFPSLYEGHPKSPLEAMACGVPVVATNVSGVREIVRHGETGWLCEPDASSLRAAIIKILADKELRGRLGRNARRYVDEHFALERIVVAEKELYEQIVDRYKANA